MSDERELTERDKEYIEHRARVLADSILLTAQGLVYDVIKTANRLASDKGDKP